MDKVNGSLFQELETLRTNYAALQASNRELVEALEEIKKLGTIPWKDSDAVHIEYWAKIAEEALRRAQEVSK